MSHPAASASPFRPALLMFPSERNPNVSRMVRRSGTAVALAAAFVLVLQSFATAWASGAMPLGPMLDGFGNPLCVTGVVHDDGAPAGDHSKVPNCCTLGCGIAAPIVPAASDAAAVWPRMPIGGKAAGWPAVSAPILDQPDHDPGSPRAPPLNA